LATSITKLKEKLKFETRLQQVPVPFTEEEYEQMIVHGLEQLYIDTARASAYEDTEIYTDEETQEVMFSEDLPIDEQAYVLLLAKIMFYNTVKTGYNNMVSYTTDAISVSNMDKPYANMQATVSALENERRIKYFKMFRFVVPD